MRALLAVAAAVMLAPTLVMAASPPRPAKSEYLVSSSAGLVMTEERGVYYSVAFSIRKPLNGPAYATIEFPNPEPSAPPFRIDLLVPAGATEISAESPRLTTLRHDTRYPVAVRLFRDEAEPSCSRPTFKTCCSPCPRSSRRSLSRASA